MTMRSAVLSAALVLAFAGSTASARTEPTHPSTDIGSPKSDLPKSGGDSPSTKPPITLPPKPTGDNSGSGDHKGTEPGAKPPIVLPPKTGDDKKTEPVIKPPVIMPPKPDGDKGKTNTGDKPASGDKKPETVVKPPVIVPPKPESDKGKTNTGDKPASGDKKPETVVKPPVIVPPKPPTPIKPDTTKPAGDKGGSPKSGRK